MPWSCVAEEAEADKKEQHLAAFNVDSHVPAKLERQRTCSRNMGMWQ